MRPSLLHRLRGQLPDLHARNRSCALRDAAGTRLHASLAAAVAAHPGFCGAVLLRDGIDALAARVKLADSADRTLDIQYYIWRQDASGLLLLEAVRRAADRGVRVRLLLDDNNTGGLDPLLSTLAAHPSIEVRLFNPFVIRRLRFLSFLTDFSRLNRRMHNKTFTVDNQVTIVGGRNIADEYFDAHGTVSFVDLDVLVAGPVVAELSASFDQYWNCDSSYPVEQILRPVSRRRASRLDRTIAQTLSGTPARALREALPASSLIPELLAGTLALAWVHSRMVVDDAAKGLGRAPVRGTLLERLRLALGVPLRTMHLVSPYLVPTKEGRGMLGEIARSGIEVNILTNSLEATDVTAVHAGYAKRRRDLLQAGVHLYELRRTSPRPPRRERRRLRDRRLTGSSGSSLHAKTFAVDGERIFVGSFNFDPRSAELNTEIGFLLDSPAFAAGLAQWFAEETPHRAYRVQLDERGALRWIEGVGDLEVIHTREPGASRWRRSTVTLLALLPIDWLL